MDKNKEWHTRVGRTYIRMFLVCLVTLGLVFFVLWGKLTGPTADGGMGVSPLAVAVVVGILVVLSAGACLIGYKNALLADPPQNEQK